MAITDEKYMAFTTYRRSGEAVTTPVWVVAVSGGRLGFWTASTSGKAKRLKNDPKIAFQASDGRGKVKSGSSQATGSAEVVASGPLFDEVTAAVKAKYGFMTKLTKLLAKVFGKRGQRYADLAVIVTPDD